MTRIWCSLRVGLPVFPTQPDLARDSLVLAAMDRTHLRNRSVHFIISMSDSFPASRYEVQIRPEVLVSSTQSREDSDFVLLNMCDPAARPFVPSTTASTNAMLHLLPVNDSALQKIQKSCPQRSMYRRTFGKNDFELASEAACSNDCGKTAALAE